MTVSFLDTSAYTHITNAHPRVLEAIKGAQHLVVPIIVLGELEAGFKIGTRSAQNRARLDAFLAQDLVEVVGIDAEVAKGYGATVALLRKNGTPLPTNDLWIAAIVSRHRGHLVTFDGDFELIPGLDVEVLRLD